MACLPLSIPEADWHCPQSGSVQADTVIKGEREWSVILNRILCVVNPHSANGATGKKWPAMAKQLKEAALEFDSIFTTRPQEAIDITRQALSKGYNQIVAVGGDGTVHEVVNGFFSEGRPVNSQAFLGVIPCGTGSDLARTLKLDCNLRQVAAAFNGASYRIIDLGKVCYLDHAGQAGERYFVNLADVGLGGETCRRVNSGSKAGGGFLSCLRGALGALFSYRNQNLAVLVDGREVYRGRAVSVAVANGRYFGGGMHMAPWAKINDGQFEVVIAGDLSKPDLLLNLYRLYRGTHLTHPKISCCRGREIRITVLPEKTGEQLPNFPENPAVDGCRPLIEVDGEQLGYAPAGFVILPGALKVKTGQ